MAYHYILSVIPEKLEEDLLAAKQRVIEKTELLVKRQKENITENVLQALDKDTRGELADNAWLHKQVRMYSKIIIYRNCFPTKTKLNIYKYTNGPYQSYMCVLVFSYLSCNLFFFIQTRSNLLKSM